MENKVLVAYATKKGGTAEIANRVGQALREAGLEVDVLPVSRVKDLAPYSAVVLGIAVYIGMWRKEAVAFLKANEGRLSDLPVWIFSSGPTGAGDPVELTKGWRFPEKQRPVIDRIGPRDVIVFQGKLDMKDMNFFEKWIIRNVKAPVGDFRDWEAIASWASGIAGALTGGSKG